VRSCALDPQPSPTPFSIPFSAPFLTPLQSSFRGTFWVWKILTMPSDWFLHINAGHWMGIQLHSIPDGWETLYGTDDWPWVLWQPIKKEKPKIKSYEWQRIYNGNRLVKIRHLCCIFTHLTKKNWISSKKKNIYFIYIYKPYKKWLLNKK